MRADKAQHFDTAQLHVDFDLRQMRAGAEHGVRTALPVLVERRGRRIEGLDDLHDEAGGVEGQGRKLNAPLVGSVRDDDCAGLERELRILADVGEAVGASAPHSARRERRLRATRNERLAAMPRFCRNPA